MLMRSLEQLGDEIAELSVHLEAATARLHDLIREFDKRDGWNSGFRSCAAWLAWRVGLDIGAARERVRVARALEDLPRLAEALAHGELSYARVRALTRVATPATEERLLAVGRAGSAEHVERIVRGWRRVDRKAEAHETKLRHRSRALHVYQDEDGMVVIPALEPDFDVLIQALTAACDVQRAKRRALAYRDHGCRFPGYDLPFGQAHHIKHWAQGGPTTLWNLVLLCRRHHRSVHEEGFRVERRERMASFCSARPTVTCCRRFHRLQRHQLTAAAGVRARNTAAGVRVHPHTATPAWDGRPLNVGWAIDVLHPLANPL